VAADLTSVFEAERGVLWIQACSNRTIAWSTGRMAYPVAGRGAPLWPDRNGPSR